MEQAYKSLMQITTRLKQYELEPETLKLKFCHYYLLHLCYLSNFNFPKWFG